MEYTLLQNHMMYLQMYAKCIKALHYEAIGIGSERHKSTQHNLAKRIL